MSTNTLIQEAVDMLCELHDSIANRSQYERCGRVISTLHTALKSLDTPDMSLVTLTALEDDLDKKPSDGVKKTPKPKAPNTPSAVSLQEIEKFFDDAYLAALSHSCKSEDSPTEESLKPKAPNVALMSLLEEIEEIFDNTCLAAEACPCAPEDVLHRLEKTKKHLKKACTSLEQYEAFFRYFEPGE